MRIVKQEHRVWSTLNRASTATADSNTVSSLVFGDNFTYSYHFTAGDNSRFLELLIYTRHENGYDNNVVMGYSDIAGAMQYCLEVGCTSLQTHQF